MAPSSLTSSTTCTTGACTHSHHSTRSSERMRAKQTNPAPSTHSMVGWRMVGRGGSGDRRRQLRPPRARKPDRGVDLARELHRVRSYHGSPLPTCHDHLGVRSLPSHVNHGDRCSNQRRRGTTPSARASGATALVTAATATPFRRSRRRAFETALQSLPRGPSDLHAGACSNGEARHP